MKRRLEREAIHNSEFFKENYTGSLDLTFLDAELAAVESEHLSLVIKDLGEYFRLKIPLIVQRIVWTVHKDGLLAGVAMDVDETSDWV